MKIVRTTLALAPGRPDGDGDEGHLPEGLRGKSLDQLAEIVYKAVDKFKLDKSWSDLLDYSRADIIEHINDMCNEFGLNVGVTGQLFKA